MPFVNGTWVPEDDSVSTRVAALTSGSSPVIQQARAAGLDTANKRGLLNSSMAAGSSEAAAIAAATPIAAQDAAQIAQKNLTYQTGQLDATKTQATLAEDLQKSREAVAQQDRAALLGAGVSANNQYLTTFGTLADNKDLPSATRDAYLQSILAARDNTSNLARSVYGVDLNWNGVTAPASSTTDGTAANPYLAIANGSTRLGGLLGQTAA